MKAILIDSEAWVDELEYDPRDRYSPDQRKRVLERVQNRHEMSVAAGGIEAAMAEGPAYVKYPNGLQGKRLREADRQMVTIHVRTFGQNLHAFFGPRRSGKTLLDGIAAKRWYEYGGQLLTNVGFGFGYRLAGAVDLLALRRSPPWTWWMVDEAHMAISKFRQGTLYQRSFIGALAAMGKQQALCSLISSQEWSFGSDVKSEVKYLVYPQKRPLRNPKGGGWLPEFLGTYGKLIGPRPWRGHTMADDYGIQLEAAIKRKRWYPSLLEIEETACSYGSYVGIPSIKESGGHIMADDMKKVDEDKVIDFGEDDRTEEQTMSFEEYADRESKAAASLAQLIMTRLTMAPPIAVKGRNGYDTINMALACDTLRRQGEKVIYEYAVRTLARIIGDKEAKQPNVDTLRFLAEQADDDDFGDDDYDYDEP